MNRPLARTLLATSLAMALPALAAAHCDTADGPVAVDVSTALAAGELTPVLKWVAPNQETELREAFAAALAARGSGDAAREVADRWFLETAVRLHRASEGAPFTGVKPAGTPIPAPIRAADAALEQGSVDTLVEKVQAEAAEGIRSRFERVRRARAGVGGSVTAGREYVHAYVSYVHYVEGVHDALTRAGGHDAARAAGE